MKKINFSSSYWFIPFFIFLAGYGTFSYLFSEVTIQVPIVVGKSLQEAAKILAQHKLNLRIIAEKEDINLSDGTVINQKPYNMHIKKNQPVFLTLSKKPNPQQLPELDNLKKKEIEEVLKQKNISYKIIEIPSTKPGGYFIAQLPHQKIVANDKKITIFISNSSKKRVIMPDLRGIHYLEVIEFLKNYSLEPEIKVLNYDNEIVTEQRPLPGTVVNLDTLKVLLIL